MTQDLVMGIARQALEMILLISLPMLGVGLVVGVVISMIQAATQIQEMTLTFVPKICAVFLTLLLLLPWMMNRLITYTIEMFSRIPGVAK